MANVSTVQCEYRDVRTLNLRKTFEAQLVECFFRTALVFDIPSRNFSLEKKDELFVICAPTSQHSSCKERGWNNQVQSSPIPNK